MKYSPFIINRAISRHEFVPFYQPIVKANTKNIIGCEVLARWLHPERGLLNAADFIESVEESPLLALMMMDLMNHISLNIKRFAPVIPDGFILSINCNFSLLSMPLFCEHLVRMTRHCRREGIDLLVELTEREDINRFPDMYRVTHNLRDQGVQFALDDYTGQYRDYDLLSVVHPQYIKLDKKYIASIHSEPESQRQIDNIISLSRLTDTRLIIEGIENQPQARYLQNKDIDYWQGFLCGSPMPSELLIYHLEQQNKPGCSLLSANRKYEVTD